MARSNDGGPPPRPWGDTRVVGEPARIPAVTAIGNAVVDAVEVRTTDIPLTPATVLTAPRATRTKA